MLLRRAVALALLFVLASPLARADRMRLVVPAYQYPTLGTLWPDLAAAAARVPVVAILNPANGPGTLVDPNYTAAVNAVRAAGGQVIGYVHTSYAARGADTVLADAARYDTLYAVDGFFVDEVTADADPAHLAYYAGLVSGLHAIAPQRPVFGNPGIACDAAYAGAVGFDALLTFEHWDGYDGWAPSAWMWGHPPSRFVNLVYARHTVAGMTSAIERAAHRNVGGIYVTDDSLANPWDSTPAYWPEELAVIETTEVTPQGAGAPHAAPPADWRVTNPARERARFRLPADRRSRTLVIADAQGRRVRTLPLPAGTTEREWDGRDANGRAATPGVYWARLDREALPALRFVLLR